MESVTPLSLLFPVSYVMQPLHHLVESGGREKGSTVKLILEQQEKITLPLSMCKGEIGQQTSNKTFCSVFVIMLLEYMMCFYFHN